MIFWCPHHTFLMEPMATTVATRHWGGQGDEAQGKRQELEIRQGAIENDFQDFQVISIHHVNKKNGPRFFRNSRNPGGEIKWSTWCIFGQFWTEAIKKSQSKTLHLFCSREQIPHPKGASWLNTCTLTGPLCMLSESISTCITLYHPNDHQTYLFFFSMIPHEFQKKTCWKQNSHVRGVLCFFVF